DKKLGLDTARIEKDLSAERQNQTEWMRAFTNMSTKDIAKADLAYQIKQREGLQIRPYDVPNWAVKGGELTTQAIPYLIVGAATGGASIPVQITANALLSGSMALGQTYSQTGSYGSSLRAAAVEAGIGATM